jgi:regulator of replication initiation timing
MPYMTKKELLEKIQPLSDRLRDVQHDLEELVEGSTDEEMVDAVERLAVVLDELEEVLSEAEEE